MIPIIAALQRPQSGIIEEVDFTTPALGPAVAALPGGMSFARSTTATSYDRVTGTIYATGINANVARYARWITGSSGLLMEVARNQSIGPNPTRWDTTGWTVQANTVYGAGPSPDGSGFSNLCTVLSTGFSSFRGTGSGGTSAGSAWFRAVAGTVDAQINVFNASSNATHKTVGTTWEWLSLVVVAPSGMVPVECRNMSLNGGTGAQNRTIYGTYAQLETGGYATSPILGAQRLQDRLYRPNATAGRWVDGGKLSLEIDFVATAALASTDTTGRVWFVDATNTCNIGVAGNVVVTVGGVTSLAPNGSVAWAAGDFVELFVAAGDNSFAEMAYRINGGTAVVVPLSGFAQPDLAIGANDIDVCCSGTTFALPCILNTIRIYRN